MYRITSREHYERLFAEQSGRCAICLLPETGRDPSGRTKRLAIDHDAETGRIRGLLCSRCNPAIGLLRHDPERLQRAIDYLSHVAPESTIGAIAVLDEAVQKR